MSTRIEKDAFGEMEVPSDALWGAQTQRSLMNFNIGCENERMPMELIRSIAVVKRCAAIANHRGGCLTEQHCNLIATAAQEVCPMHSSFGR